MKEELQELKKARLDLIKKIKEAELALENITKTIEKAEYYESIQ